MKFVSKVNNRQYFHMKNSLSIKNCLLITLLSNFLVPFKWTPIERSLKSLVRSLVVKLLIDNIFIERLGLSR